MTSKTTNKYSPEVSARTVRMVLDHEGEHPSPRATATSIAGKTGCPTHTLMDWVKKADIEARRASGVPAEVAERPMPFGYRISPLLPRAGDVRRWCAGAGVGNLRRRRCAVCSRSGARLAGPVTAAADVCGLRHCGACRRRLVAHARPARHPRVNSVRASALCPQRSGCLGLDVRLVSKARLQSVRHGQGRTIRRAADGEVASRCERDGDRGGEAEAAIAAADAGRLEIPAMVTGEDLAKPLIVQPEVEQHRHVGICHVLGPAGDAPGFDGIDPAAQRPGREAGGGPGHDRP